MASKIDIWLDRFGRLISILRPKSYNRITWAVIVTGFALLEESQFSILQRVMFSLLIRAFDLDTKILSLEGRDVAVGYGFALVVLALVYHSLCEIGGQLIRSRQDGISQSPEFDVRLTNIDGEVFLPGQFPVRGKHIDVPSRQDIPDYRSERSSGGMFGSYDFHRDNWDYHREMATFFHKWGGSEIWRLELKNSSEVVSSGTKLVIAFPESANILLSNCSIEEFRLPENSRDVLGAARFIARFDQSFDFYEERVAGELRFVWDIGDMAGGTDQASTYVYIKPQESISMKVRVISNQFSRPVEFEYEVLPAQGKLDLAVEDLMTWMDDEEVLQGVGNAIMEGYLGRHLQLEYEKMMDRE